MDVALAELVIGGAGSPRVVDVGGGSGTRAVPLASPGAGSRSSTPRSTRWPSCTAARRTPASATGSPGYRPTPTSWRPPFRPVRPTWCCATTCWRRSTTPLRWWLRWPRRFGRAARYRCWSPAGSAPCSARPWPAVRGGRRDPDRPGRPVRGRRTRCVAASTPRDRRPAHPGGSAGRVGAGVGVVVRVWSPAAAGRRPGRTASWPSWRNWPRCTRRCGKSRRPAPVGASPGIRRSDGSVSAAVTSDEIIRRADTPRQVHG